MSYIPFEELSVYEMSRDISRIAWDIYEILEKTLQWSIGSQWIRAVDSIGANIAEGYGRYHTNDKKRFYYIARASLFESKHWLSLLQERSLISTKQHTILQNKFNNLGKSLNVFITSQK